jgi:hypothetical protein
MGNDAPPRPDRRYDTTRAGAPLTISDNITSDRPPKGLHCPTCRAVHMVVGDERVPLIVTTSTRSPTAGTKRRYKTCRRCGTPFRTVERVDRVCSPGRDVSQRQHTIPPIPIPPVPNPDGTCN